MDNLVATANAAAFFRLVKHPFKFRLFLLSKLPSAYFAGIRIRNVDENSSEVTVPYKWFTQNPFRSTYFACLSMAAEMSTGVLAMACLYKLKPNVSMLVVKVESEYFKKATGKTSFICKDGVLIRNIIKEAIESGEAKGLKARSVGMNDNGEAVAEFFVTWSFKVKTKKA